MTKNVILLFKISLFFFLISCNSSKKNNKTFFGGKIINPKSNEVILYSMEKVIDTFFLDTKNRFIGKIENANEGLYHFSHGDENQYVYIEPEDSLMLRLNTWDFDESLVFAGKGAERNNILIDCFLENENDGKLFYRYNKLPPNDFTNKVDSLLSVKMDTYNDYLKNHPNETLGYREILKTALTYPIYARLERYPYINAKYTKDGNFPELSEAFYTYRKSISINKDSLMYFPPYSRFIRNYLYNETYALGHPPMKTEYSAKFTIDLLKTIDKNITAEKTKNAILRQTIISHFFNKSSCNLDNESFSTFFKLSTNKKDKELITSLVNDVKSVPTHKRLPNFKVTNYNNTTHEIAEIIKNKNTFLFFWSPEYVSQPYIIKRIKYLSNNYPNINFIQVKIDGVQGDRIQKIDIKNQYYLKSDSDAHQFLSSKMPRSILVNKQGKVVNAYATISSRNLNPFLKELNEN
ncbi:TlpA family protein disulfide reductase [Polaribacter sp. R77954]|uniref:TlpA family protein disulfide reductase n=1 Tax=Polaribacter sp. R77954 TaxID=3093870 RepID=UPI0037C8293C